MLGGEKGRDLDKLQTRLASCTAVLGFSFTSPSLNRKTLNPIQTKPLPLTDCRGLYAMEYTLLAGDA